MTLTPSPLVQELDGLDMTPAKSYPHRWRVSRAGILDVWYYYDTEFDFSGGRLVLRGTNGAGKSRALELLLPFVLDADRRKMDAAGSGKVSLVELMKAGVDDRTTRGGYLWLELARTVDPADLAVTKLHETGRVEEHLTIGAHVRFSRSTGEVKVHYFTTDLRVGSELKLLSPSRETLSREALAERIGADRITSSPATHRDRVRATVFTLTGEAGGERFAGLLQLLYTLRSPDVGNRIEEGRLPQILSDALPPLSEAALNAAGEQLDGLSETRAAQARLETAFGHVSTFLGTYRRYVATAIAVSVAAADYAATGVEIATADTRDRETRRSQLETDRGSTQAHVVEVVDTLAELDATIAGIKQSEAYAGARDLDEREKKVGALRTAADIALRSAANARSAESREAATAENAAGEVADAASVASAAVEALRAQLELAGVSGSLPIAIAATVEPGSAATEPVRLTRDGDVAPFPRPAPTQLRIIPADLGAADKQIALVRHSADERSRQAEGRLSRAKELESQHRKVEDAQRRADEAEERVRGAEEAESERRLKLDQAAASYAEQWQAWRIRVDTLAAYGVTPDFADTPLAIVIDGSTTSVADLSDDDLTALDRVAEALAKPVIEIRTRHVAALDAADDQAAALRAELLHEQDQLNSEVDPSPTTPAWLAQPNTDAIPLWRAVDFGDELNLRDRAGLEGALLASGLLLATLHDDGTLRAEDGQLLLAPVGPAVTPSIAGNLVADPSAPVRAELIEAILMRIGYGPGQTSNAESQHDSRHRGVWVALDGSWGTGPLSGRYAPETARHIGATARAVARLARLSAITAELDDLAAAQRTRATERTEARRAIARLEAVTRAAPRTQPVAAAVIRVEEAGNQVAKERFAFRTAAAEAAKRRLTWTRASDEHRTICAQFGLPHTAQDLDEVQRAARKASSDCQQIGRHLTELIKRVALHNQALAKVADRVAERGDAETHAAEQWDFWHREASEFEAINASIGQDAESARAELRSCETVHHKLVGELTQLRKDESALSGKLGAAEVEARNAADRLTKTQAALATATDQLRLRVALPGLAAAAVADQASLVVELPEIDPAAVHAEAARVAARLRPHSQEVDENTLIRPQQTLERELSGAFDVHAEVREGVRLIELSDATGRRSIADAAAELSRLVQEGRSALSEREREIFTEFVLGGIAEELRRRLDQAASLVDAMTASLSTIRTSHGIGVKLRWRLADESAPAIRRIKDLISTAGAVRSAEQAAELTHLLKTRVDEAFAQDESAGYTARLREALDYREWHTVEVIIIGPDPGQERRISRKARLSQGETRFVSYVTLFAAIDAYLTGLPDTGRALRLLLLDDAFAKVDDRTIGELMGLLVRLDIDFAMTGHALWGTYSQVPTLDCYEVRRIEGSAAYTTHVHWDGHTRHLPAVR